MIGDSWTVGDNNVSIRHPAMSQTSHQEHSQDTPWMTSENIFNSDDFLQSSDLASDEYLPSSPPRVMNMDSLVSRATYAMMKPRKGSTNVSKRAELPVPVLDFMNVDGCLQRVFLQWFREPDLPPDYPKEWCCSNCNPALDVTDTELGFGSDTVVQPDDCCPELEARFRTWLQSWIEIHIRQYDYPPRPEWLFPRTYITEIARSSFPVQRQAVREFLETAPGFQKLGDDGDRFIDFILDRKTQPDFPIQNSQPTAKRTNSKFGRPIKQKPLMELNANITSTRKRRK